MTGDDVQQSSPVALTDEDKRRLELFDRKLQLIRDRTAGVAKGLHTGLHVYGDPGIGKTFTVVEELTRLRVPYRLTNTRVTARGLFDLLARQPEEIHILDDVETLVGDVQGPSVLRAAAWGHGRKDLGGRLERLICWETHRDKRSFVFTGGLIMVGNRPLDHVPELEALKTRIATLQLQASDLEVAAMMRSIALEGRTTNGFSLSPAERLQVAEYIIDQSRGLNLPLNLRLLENGIADYIQWIDCDAGCHWKDQISSRLRERPTITTATETAGARELRKQTELQIARSIASLSCDIRLQQWQQQTGKSKSAMYRRLAELGEEDNSHFQGD